jgi:uncharacterized membrane protein YdjX (TVP38/TMEM64 family)
MESAFLVSRVTIQLTLAAIGGAFFSLWLRRYYRQMWRRSRIEELHVIPVFSLEGMTRHEIVLLFTRLSPAGREEILATLREVA